MIEADLAAAAARLAAAGCGNPRLDAQLLLAETLHVGREALVGYRSFPLTLSQMARFEALLDRRAAREPMAQILGRREFWGRQFQVTSDTLDPRPDSETLIAAALERADARRILDLGAGSGCLLLTLLAERPDAQGVGIDLSDGALDVARRNAEALGLAGRVAFRQGEWFAPLRPGERFDLIVSNPPYIPTDEIDALAPEIARFEPRLALDGGADGLDAYRRLAAGLADIAAPGALILFETGMGQARGVAALLGLAGAIAIDIRRDLSGIERVVAANWPASPGIQK